MRRLVVTLACATLGFSGAMADAASRMPGCDPCAGPLLRVPVTKSYRILPGYSPRQLAQMVVSCVPVDNIPLGGAPFGIPPIYTTGDYLVVRQTPEVHARISQYLVDLGVYVVPRVAPD